MPSPLLEIRNATKIYETGGFLGTSKKSVVALDNFNMRIDESPATITTIAGESGSGKTTLANLMLGFIRLTSGQIIYDGKDVTNMTDDQLRVYRRNVQAVFQDPFGVYNPFYRIDHVFDIVNKHFNLSDSKSAYRDMVEEGLNVVGLYGEDVLRKYPHQLSGGQRQRIMMARAYMIKPRLIVADEPVSMVDASLRASILDAMLRLRDDHGISFLYITHDLSTAYQIGDKIYMLYQGTTAERGSAVDVIDKPQHPYVQLLIDSVPVPDPTEKWDVNISLPSEEEMRTASAIGCRYYPRCPHRMDKCLTAQPPLYIVGENEQEASCYLYDENEIAPEVEHGELKSDEEWETAALPKRRTPWAAIITVVVIAAIALFALTSGNQGAAPADTGDDTEVSENTTDATETVVTDDGEEDEPEAVIAFTTEGATEKSALELDTPMTDEITSEDETHSYTFEGTAGQTVLFKVNAEGSAFTSPYGVVYDPDGNFLISIGDVTARATRSYREETTLPADGTYTIIVGSYDGNGIEEYAVVVESVEVEAEAEAPATDDTSDDTGDAEVVVPEVLITADGGTEKSALVLNESAIDEITSEDEKHVYTFEASEGQTIELRINAEGSAFTSPYAYMYDADGEFVTVAGDTTVRAKRSWRGDPVTLSAGTYTVVVGPYDGNGIEEYAVLIEGVEVEEAAAGTTDTEPANVEEEIPEPTFELPVEGAIEKSALELDTPAKDEITAEDEYHSYTYEGTAGQRVMFKVNAEGSAFTSPYGSVYAPDGTIFVAIGDVTARATRSYRQEVTLPADGTYTIIVGSYDGNGIEEYAVEVETVTD